MQRPRATLTARERVRAELTQEILDVARAHLTEHGSAGLSLRAIARELGMVSSAIYRYFPSRDDLLTALIVDAYTHIGTAAEQAEAAVPRADLLGRWLGCAHAARTWAVAHPQEYALIFGSPIPGYRAPADTIDPAARIPFLLLQIQADASSAGLASPGDPAAPAPPAPVTEDLSALHRLLDEEMRRTLDDATLARGIAAWTMLVGSISFELFGHLNNVIHDYATYFDYQMRTVAASLGIRASASQEP